MNFKFSPRVLLRSSDFFCWSDFSSSISFCWESLTPLWAFSSAVWSSIYSQACSRDFSIPLMVAFRPSSSLLFRGESSPCLSGVGSILFSNLSPKYWFEWTVCFRTSSRAPLCSFPTSCSLLGDVAARASPAFWVSSGQSTVGYKRRTFLLFSCFLIFSS